MNTGQKLVTLGSIGLLIGAALPWSTITSVFGTINVAGLVGDGKITAAVGVLLLLGGLLYKGNPGRMYSIATTIFALLALVLLGDAWRRLAITTAEAIETTGLFAQVGTGIYVSIVGGIISACGGIARVSKEK